MKKYLFLSAMVVLITTVSFAQTKREQIEKAMNDPKAAENAAKADVLLIDKKKISDSTSYNATPEMSKKEKSCLFKRKKRSAKKSL